MGTVHSVAVEERFLPLVYRTLADAYEGATASGGGGSGGYSETPGDEVSAQVWVREEVMRVYQEGTPALRAVFDHLAEQAPEPVRSRDLAHAVYPDDSADEAEGKLYGVLGAFGRKSSSVYGKTAWFFDADRERLADGTRGYFVYTMERREAAWIKEASGRE